MGRLHLRQLMTKAHLANISSNSDNLFIYIKLFAIFTLVVWASAIPKTVISAVSTIEVVALFEDKAMVIIDGKRQLLNVGEQAAGGAKLVKATARSAIFEIDGKRREYPLGQLVRQGPERDNEKKQIRIYRDTHDLYHTTGSINGFPVNFLVDTGASSIAISSVQAKRLGVNYKLKGKPTWVSTASGTEAAYQVTLDRVTLGDVTLRSIEGLVIEGSSPDTPLLGMSYLSRFNIYNTGRVMVLEKKY